MASYSVLSPPSARLMMRWMLSLGTLLALALEIRAASLLLEAGSLPPSRTATLISRPILVKILARAPSVFSFLRLMLFHLLCPDMEFPPMILVCFLGRDRRSSTFYCRCRTGRGGQRPGRRAMPAHKTTYYNRIV